MTKVCVYLVNEKPFYLKMAANSIHMLRRFNTTIPIRVFYISASDPSSEFVRASNKYNFEIVLRKPLKVEGEEGYFPINKYYLKENTENQVLFIDSDTFVFGNVDELFQKYEEADVAACWNKWVEGRGWQPNFLGIRPLNSGVMLWRGTILQSACASLLEYCRELREDQSYLGRWLWSLEQNCWQREEFAYSLFVDRNKLNYSIFQKMDVWNILNNSDFETMEESTIFHSYSAQWQQCFNQLCSKKLKLKRKLVMC